MTRAATTFIGLAGKRVRLWNTGILPVRSAGFQPAAAAHDCHGATGRMPVVRTSTLRVPQRAFTLLEVVLAVAAAAILLAAVFGLFLRVLKLRDKSTENMRSALVNARAVTVLKNDLLNGRIVSSAMRGGIIGMETAPNGARFPGYLRFTTTTGRDTPDAPYGDTQEVEYYVDDDAQSENTEAGVLVRTIDRVLLADNPEIQTVERLLTNVQALELEFYDGTNWQTTWDSATATPTDTTSSSTASPTTAAIATTTSGTPPKAVRVRIVSYAAQGKQAQPPIELVVPWSTETP